MTVVVSEFVVVSETTVEVIVAVDVVAIVVAGDVAVVVWVVELGLTQAPP